MREDLMRWQAQRHAELSGPDSWLGMQGLFWLEPGVNQVGSGEHCGVRLPSGPVHLGDLIRDGERVYWQLLGDSARELATDRLGQPTTVDHENLAFSSSTVKDAWRPVCVIATGLPGSLLPACHTFLRRLSGQSRRNGRC